MWTWSATCRSTHTASGTGRSRYSATGARSSGRGRGPRPRLAPRCGPRKASRSLSNPVVHGSCWWRRAHRCQRTDGLAGHPRRNGWPGRRRSVRKLGVMSEQDHIEPAAAGTHVVGTERVKRGMAEMLKSGVIMDVVTPEQAKFAEDAGAVMALERVPADIRAQGGVSRMSDPDMIDGIISAVSIPVMAKARIGHFVEAQILQSLGVDYIDESEVLTPADYANHIDKWKFTVPFVCGATNLGEALRRITEGAAMIRSKGEAGTGDVSNATTHMRKIGGEIRRLGSLSEDELYVAAKELQAPYDLVVEVAKEGKLPVTMFTAGGIATPADAAMMMQLGAEGVFVGSGIFKSGNPAERAAAIVKATTFFDDPDVLAKVSRGLGEAMVGINVDEIPQPHRLAERGW